VAATALEPLTPRPPRNPRTSGSGNRRWVPRRA
jgi:hypothetical protein